MQKHLHLALMASPIIATFLSLTPEPAQAAADGCNSQRLTAVTDDTGRAPKRLDLDGPCSSERKPE